MMRFQKGASTAVSAARRLALRNSAARSVSTAVIRSSPSQWTSGVVVASMMGCVLLSSDKRITLNHCQVPCGIFDDPAMVGVLKESCTTIRKAMVQSKALHGTIASEPLSLNQMVRWINTKEEHCNKIITLIGEYCLCQRVKRVNFASETDYLQALKLHHLVMQAAMKAKQTMDEAACAELEHAVEDLSKMYTK